MLVCVELRFIFAAGMTVIGYDDGSLIMLSIESASSSMTPGRKKTLSLPGCLVVVVVILGPSSVLVFVPKLILNISVALFFFALHKNEKKTLSHKLTIECRQIKTKPRLRTKTIGASTQITCIMCASVRWKHQHTSTRHFASTLRYWANIHNKKNIMRRSSSSHHNHSNKMRSLRLTSTLLQRLHTHTHDFKTHIVYYLIRAYVRSLFHRWTLYWVCAQQP